MRRKLTVNQIKHIEYRKWTKRIIRELARQKKARQLAGIK